MKISKEAKIGLIAVIVSVAFFWLFNFLNGKNLFTSGRVFYVKYSNVDGLLPTKPINVNGLRVGRVDQIEIKELPDSIYFVVTLVLERNLDFSKNTTAEIYEPGFLEGKMVKLNLDFNGPKAESGDTLRGVTGRGIINEVTEKLTPTKNRIDTVLTTFNRTLSNVNRLTDEDTNVVFKKTLNELQATISTLRLTAQSLNSLAKNANQLVSNSGGSINTLTSETQKTMSTATATLDKFGGVADKINAMNLEETLQNLEKATASLEATLSNVENGKGTLNKLVNDSQLYDNLNEASANLSALMQDFKENPDRYVQVSVFGKRAKRSKKEKEE